MKARLPQGMGGGGAANLQQLARQAQKMQEQMEQITTELEAKEYTAAAGGGAVSATVTGKMEVKNIDIKPEVIDLARSAEKIAGREDAAKWGIKDVDHYWAGDKV